MVHSVVGTVHGWIGTASRGFDQEAIPRIGARDKLQELLPDWQRKPIPTDAGLTLLSYLLPIDITTMGDTQDEHGFGAVVDVQQNSVITDSHSPGIGSAD